jgi:uncharacterized protein YdcH (DUF465 family)
MKLKQKSKIEYYKGLIRQLKADNQRLKKLLSRYEYVEDDDNDDEEFEEYSQYKKDNECPNCDEGKLIKSEVVGRLIIKCDECEYRKVERIDG